jgi:hypothetical protein
MLKKILVFLPLLSLLLQPAIISAATVTKTLDGPEWEYQGKPTPSTHWSPWMPVPSMVVRYKFGVRFSTGTIAIKCPTKVDFSYDSQQAKGGKVLTLNITANRHPVRLLKARSAFIFPINYRWDSLVSKMFPIYFPGKILIMIYGIYWVLFQKPVHIWHRPKTKLV